jgi:hypothetical protein
MYTKSVTVPSILSKCLRQAVGTAKLAVCMGPKKTVFQVDNSNAEMVYYYYTA